MHLWDPIASFQKLAFSSHGRCTLPAAAQVVECVSEVVHGRANFQEENSGIPANPSYSFGQ